MDIILWKSTTKSWVHVLELQPTMFSSGEKKREKERKKEKREEKNEWLILKPMISVEAQCVQINEKLLTCWILIDVKAGWDKSLLNFLQWSAEAELLDDKTWQLDLLFNCFHNL